MSLEQIRIDLVSAISARSLSFEGNYPLVIEYDNILEVDTQTQTNPYLRVDIKMISMEQADLADSPFHRATGQLVLGAGIKEGQGVKAANAILMHFYPALQGKTLGMVRTHMATIAPATPHLGWLYFPVIIPFWADLRYSQ